MTRLQKFMSMLRTENFSMQLADEMLNDMPYLMRIAEDDSTDVDEIVYTICDKKVGIKIDNNTVLCSSGAFALLKDFDFSKVVIKKSNMEEVKRVLGNHQLPTTGWAKKKYILNKRNDNDDFSLFGE